MTVDPLGLAPEVGRANERLAKTVESLDDAAVAAPSRLPGWTRGHVLTHVARNADSYVNLLTWARTGVETPQYASAEKRDADIEAGAARTAAELSADLRAAADRFDAAAAAMTPAAWSATIRYNSGVEVPAAHIVWGRLREVEVHHVDLGAGYGPPDWSDAFTLRLLHEVTANLAGSGPPLRLTASDPDFASSIGVTAATPVPSGGPVVTAVRGPARELAAWLIGRSLGAGLTAEPAGPLPPLPTWK